MMYLNPHLMMLPILLPLLAGATMVFINERHHRLKFLINLSSTAVMLFTAIQLLIQAQSGLWPADMAVYLAANWSAPFGIALVADRLAAVMLILTATLGAATLVFSYSRWSKTGVHFHTLFQLLLMGINGAILTADLFNLFVFFEVMLAASYGLLLHGYNISRIRAGMQYIVVNLVASLFFLIGIALVYAATGTLNFADLALKIATLDNTDRFILQTGAAILAVAFLTKSAMWPLSFWLPVTYSAACAPVAAMLVLLTKIGVYVILRLWWLLFSEHSGASAGFGGSVLLCGGLLTLAFGAVGLLASQEPRRIASFSAIISSGTLLALIGYGDAALLSSALFYLISSTLAVAAFIMLTELTDRIYTPAASVLALSMEAFAVEEDPQETAGVVVPAAMAFLGLTFAACALVMAGLPPLSGFVAKFSILHGLLDSNAAHAPLWARWLILTLLLVAGLSAIIALMRFGVRTFWTLYNSVPLRLHPTEALPILAILLLGVSMVFTAGPLFNLLDRVSTDLQQTPAYIERVLQHPVISTEEVL
jgi:multicomponent K+:H+ antiporter subunit D